MKYDLEFARKQVADLERFRFFRALSGTTDEFRYVFQLIALLLHANHPNLPGFVANAPTGIADFKLTDYQRHYLHELLAQSPDVQFSQIFDRTSHAIDGVYVMGSIASIAQTSSSDLDIWVCLRNGLKARERKKLQQKATALQNWAKQFEVDVNLFLMDQNRFRNFQSSGVMTEENCGSAQYMLLLDEFYRSAIRLAGKPLLWLHLLVEDEKNYESEVEDLVRRGEIDPQEWVDFGGLSKFSANEYFGAGLWQLYKGIDAPYKSVIKILLLEEYSWEYPNTRLIASDFKFHLLMDHTEDHHFDPYLEMLERVTNYLTYRKDFKRLEDVRRCFYLKSTEDWWYHSESNWRMELINRLAQDWGWSKETIQDLNLRPFWKIKRVKQSYGKLMQMLMISYRNLIDFARKHHVDANIVPQDISILTRKIYTAFEELPGKVLLINPQISTDLSEPYLTFVEVTATDRPVKKGWYMLNQAPEISGFSHPRYTEYSATLHKLVASVYFNGLLTPNTQLYIQSPNVSLSTLQEFITNLAETLPVRVPPPTNDDLHHPCEIRQLMVAINLSCDPTKQLTDSKTPIQQSDLFSFGTEQQNLVGSIDFIYRNLWNEIRTLHFEGPNAILMALKVLSNKIHHGSTALADIAVYSYSRHYRRSLANIVTALIKKCIDIQLGINQPSNTQSMLRVAGKNWQFFFEERGISLQELPESQVLPENNLDEELQAEINENDNVLPVQSEQNPPEKLQYPAEIDSFASEGFLQFFFEDNNDDTFNVYILDEKNHIEIYHRCDGEKEQKINEINHIYTNADSSGNNPYGIIQRNFNYPQFYRIIHNRYYEGSNPPVHIVPFQRQAKYT
ncbi:class I adenylate cyclase [Bisgaard Taxon 10/6]|uniref:class I adenylate cyclase n=1 Tax=Exercitatus varius TaxID=67857 RepID=UPI00294B00BA|nr:class I adenylate cyclase [Exercitatus varius]MDG2956449.1 class I adenylate cyclase [Exercitatus varius]MDG2964775.1 class I adenylate cyclase [Exercitatus varius]